MSIDLDKYIRNNSPIDQIRSGFLDLMKRAGREDDFRIEYPTLYGNGHPIKNIIRLSGSIDALVYFLGRSSEPCQWVVSPGAFDVLIRSDERWFLVLLCGRSDRGYILSGEETLRCASTWSDLEHSWQRGYTVRRDTLPDTGVFRSFDRFFEKLKNAK